MICKLTRVEAPVETVLDVFRDTDAWPRWMPGVASTHTLEYGDGRRLVEVVLRVLGRRRVQKLECVEREGRLSHRQVEGWFRKWQADWTFRPPPEGGGTILSLALELDLGVAGLLLPRKFLAGWVRGLMNDTVDRARDRAEALARRRREPTAAVKVGEPLLEVYETAGGFEVHFAGRTFLIEAADLRLR